MKELKIVIAEDSTPLRKLLQRTLSVIAGFTIVGEAVNGDEAVQLVKKFKPDVLILDLQMPVKDGLDALREIRKDDDLTFIIIYTTCTLPADRDLCLEAGADHFLDKSRINELVEICRDKLLAS